MITLNARENREYNNIQARLKSQPQGHFYFRDVCGSAASVARIAIVFREDVLAGKYPNISMVSTLSRDGYILR